ncbi:2-oxoglutarate-dependent dioxygenase AOP3 [Hirschfeldia incana]|nr:2-oxoglutarate-dependent dioxygenase AOP3 [Hirschfeldia incana]
MGSDSTPQLPLIYLSDQTLKPGSEKWVELRSDVRKALEDYGGFEVSYDRVSEELKKSVLEAMKELFELPVEAKKRNVSPKPYTGYMTHNGISESLGIQDANVLEKVNEFTQLLCPDCEGNKSTSETIQKFSEKLAELDVMVRRMVMESFGIEKYFDEHLKSTNYRLRLMKYIAPPDFDTNVAVGVNGAGDGANTNNSRNADPDVGYGDSASAGDSASVIVSDDANVGADTNDIFNSIANLHIDGEATAGAKAYDNVDAGVDAKTSDHCAIVKSNAKFGIDVNANTDVGTSGDANANSNTRTRSSVNVGVGDSVKANGADDEEKKLGLPTHTDKNLLTVLYQYEIEGLEVLTKDEKWIRLKPSHNSFVVMAGDSLYGLMNGRLTRPFHRVRVTEKKKTRYSIALFSTPNGDYIIEPPKELVDEKHPRVFKPFTYVDLMSFYHTEVGRRARSTLHAYCALSRA